MTTHDIAPPLAAALAGKGYSHLTPVQEAVLVPDAAGRDLLVSSQTGSGKTVAFGLAIAPDFLAGADLLAPADRPLALIVAPTRELALQVARELEWLYAGVGARLATCVGGMDYRSERRALERGAHVVVGTPGRLRDHIERGSLDLTGLGACVLDEADEMLDLGFREDLEFILASTPDDRRTLMFSATVPKAIAELAKTFQKDALRIQTAGEAKQHVDIEYRALSVSVRDREPAIFNLLRLYEARTAIVFCKTRVNVNHLLARMGNRGFQAVALSGELSQQERMHALQALRDGRARVCIATDVAARGIDLPGLELVIHADLPTNSETLLHRSGRTGRAGAKGVSALIVTPADYKKAQRLLQGARVVAEWGKAPSAEEVQTREDARLLEHPALTTAPGEDAGMAAQLLERFGPEQVAAAVIRLWREGRSAPEVLSEAVAPQPSAPRERGAFGPSVWFELSVGHTGRAEARWLLPKICEAGGITKDSIGAIRVREDVTFVQIATEAAPRFGQTLEIEPGIEMRRLAGEPVLERPERAPRPAPSPRPLRSEEERPAPDLFQPGRPAEKAPRPKDRAERPRAADLRPAAAEQVAKVQRPAPREEDRGTEPAAGTTERKKARWTTADRKAAKGKPRAAGYLSHGAGGEGGSRADRSTGYRSHGAPARDGAEPKPRAAGFKSQADKGKPGKPAPKSGFPKPSDDGRRGPRKPKR